MYKGILTHELPKKNGERKGRLTLNTVDEHGNCSELTIKEFLEHSAPYKPSKFSEGEFLKALYAKLDMREKMDMNLKFKRDGITSFLCKLAYLQSLVRYNKKQGVIA